MSRSTGRRKRHFRNRSSTGTIKLFADWPPANRLFYADFRQWLVEGGYSDSTLRAYSVAVQVALGLLNKPYWLIDPDTDLEQVNEYLVKRYSNHATRDTYKRGMRKLAEYLRYHRHRPHPEPPVNWHYHLYPLPDWLAADVHAYIEHRQHAWLPEQRRRMTQNLLSQLTRSLRWMTARVTLNTLSDLTPARWFQYVDARLSIGIRPTTLDDELRCLQAWLIFLGDRGHPVCQRLLRLEPSTVGTRLPRDVPVNQLRLLVQEIEAEAASSHIGVRRMGIMDRAWFLIMLHSGLRTGEVCRLRLTDLDVGGRCARIEQSKGLKDRAVCLSHQAADALQAYQAVRGPSALADDHVFLYRHRPLNHRYCLHRLLTYGQRCGVRVTPHQLRHSCATLLLNAGVPILTIQAILGHKHVDTTLGYARLYDSTVVAGYSLAMGQVESRVVLM